MKKILFILLFLPCLSFAQSDKISGNSIHETYCMIIATPKSFSKKMDLTVDYGYGLPTDAVLQKLSPGQLKEVELLTHFTSVVEALNYMGTQGWEFVNSYAITIDKYNFIIHYILKKKV